MIAPLSLFAGNGMEETPTKKQEDVTQTAEAKDLPTPYSTDENYGSYRKLDESEIEPSNKQNYSTKNSTENGETKTNNEEVEAPDESKTTNGDIKATNSEHKATNKDDETKNEELNEKMYNYVQNIMMTKSGTDLAINDKNGNEAGLLPESTTVVRFSPIWKQVITFISYRIDYVYCIIARS